MRSPDYVGLDRRLSNLLSLTATAEDDSRDHLLRFGAVLAAGLIEVACQEILEAFSAKRSHQTVASFVGAQLSRYQNINSERLCQLVGAFDGDRRRELEEFMREQVGASIDSLVNVRNGVAHGRSTGIGLSTLQQYLGDVRRVIRFLEERFPRS